jgi:hypothetical protein
MFVLRKVNPPGLSARADEANLANLTLAATTDGLQKGDYLEWSDPNAKHGFGDEGWTGDVSKAKKFWSFRQAMECWKAQSHKRPYRDDGEPNRPLTAYSVMVEKVP